MSLIQMQNPNTLTYYQVTVFRALFLTKSTFSKLSLVTS